MSDYLKGHLVDDVSERGIILGREVQIKRRANQKPGEETDILVTAVRKRSGGEAFDSLSVVVEVKGCWNRDLMGAMKSQLVDRYLKDNLCQHGLYVVGWFDQESWDERDSRRRQAPKFSPDVLREQLDLQASDVSKDGLIIKSYVLDFSLR